MGIEIDSLAMELRLRQTRTATGPHAAVEGQEGMYETRIAVNH